MGLSASKEAVLRALVREGPPPANWALFGSVDTVLRGLDDDPDDIDLLATESAAERFRDAFADSLVDTRELGVSQIDEYRLRGEELEVLYSVAGKDHQEPLVDLRTVTCERTGDLGVPLLPLGPLVAAYRQIDKHETADRLESAFGPVDQ